MKTLYLIRHAKSSWKHSGISDHERPLNKRGESDAPLMANILKEKDIFPDLILSSDAVRANEFAKIIAGTLSYKEKDIYKSNELYLANEYELLRAVKEIDDKYDTVFLVSHNPGITYFANLLCNYNLDNIPTSGIFGIKFNENSWKDVKFGNGEFLIFEYPKKYIL